LNFGLKRLAGFESENQHKAAVHCGKDSTDNTVKQADGGDFPLMNLRVITRKKMAKFRTGHDC
jgi:hypothetical protein